MGAPTFLLLAGEPSGDLYGGQLAQALRARWPGCRIFGMGGDRMAAQGVQLVARLDTLAVMGFVEVLSRLPYFFRLGSEIRRLMVREGVDVLIPIDYPGFNLRMAKRAHRLGVPVVYYIAPQVWAWKEGRTTQLARIARRIAVILPFEEALFQRAGGRVTFVGHPLLQEGAPRSERGEFCARWGIDPDRPILALFPGSRKQEIRRHLAPFLGAALEMRRRQPELQVALALAPSLTLPPTAELSGVHVVSDGPGLLAQARGALVKSGTTTLEATLAGVPFVVAYRTHPVTYALARRLVRVPYVALPNLVAGRRVVPELLQGDVVGERLVSALEPLLAEGPERGELLAGLAQVRSLLGTPGASARVAELVAEVLAEVGEGRNG